MFAARHCGGTRKRLSLPPGSKITMSVPFGTSLSMRRSIIPVVSKGTPALVTRASMPLAQMWRRDDADDALRSGPEHAGAFGEMVLAQGLGDKDCQAPRDEEGNRCPGASVGRDHASHLGRWHRIPIDQGGRRSVRTVRDQIRYEKT